MLLRHRGGRGHVDYAKSVPCMVRNHDGGGCRSLHLRNELRRLLCEIKIHHHEVRRQRARELVPTDDGTAP